MQTHDVCAWCRERVLPSRMGVHVRDTGDLDVRPVDACIVLFDLRNSHRVFDGA